MGGYNTETIEQGANSESFRKRADFLAGRLPQRLVTQIQEGRSLPPTRGKDPQSGTSVRGFPSSLPLGAVKGRAPCCGRVFVDDAVHRALQGGGDGGGLGRRPARPVRYVAGFRKRHLTTRVRNTREQSDTVRLAPMHHRHCPSAVGHPPTPLYRVSSK